MKLMHGHVIYVSRASHLVRATSPVFLSVFLFSSILCSLSTILKEDVVHTYELFPLCPAFTGDPGLLLRARSRAESVLCLLLSQAPLEPRCDQKQGQAELLCPGFLLNSPLK